MGTCHGDPLLIVKQSGQHLGTVKNRNPLFPGCLQLHIVPGNAGRVYHPICSLHQHRLMADMDLSPPRRQALR